MARCLLLAIALLNANFSAPAQEASPESVPLAMASGLPAEWKQAARFVARQWNEREALQMTWAILQGSQMGPGEGWFHPGQSRFDWKWLADRFDADASGAVSSEELKVAPHLFSRLDRNRDGAIRPDDFDWSDRSPFVRQSGQAAGLFGKLDVSSNGRVTPDEWQKFFEDASGDKGFLTPDDLRWALMPPAPAGPRPAGPSKPTLLLGLASGEIGSLREGPAVGELAPDFALKTHDGREEIRLSQFRGKQPVVLVFGSFT